MCSGDATCSGMNGDVRQTELFDAAFITDAEINPFCRAQVRRQVSDENIVFRGHSALEAAPRRGT
jgi:hypothetical protein